MLKRFAFVPLFALAASIGIGAIVQQNDFTQAQNGTLPADLTASYDPGVDVLVVPFGSANPTPPADHAGGDGYVCQVGDLGTGGGGYDWVYSATAAVQTDCKMTAWIYVDWVNWDTPTALERDYMVMLRMQNDRDPQVQGSAAGTRQGYIFLVTANSSWTGLAVPTNFRPFIMKKVATTHTLIGSEGTNDVLTGWHLFEFTVQGTQLTGKIDGATVCSGTDSEYASGYSAIGFYEDNGAALNNPYAAAVDNMLYETVTADVSDWSIY